MSRLTLTTGVLAIVAALAGCGSDATGTDTPGSPAPATAAPATAEPAPVSPAPATLSQEEAAASYLDIVRPYNEALERLEEAINGGEPVRTLTELAGDTADALEAEIAQLRDTAWPAEVRPHVDDLVAVSEEALGHWQQAAGAQTRDELVEEVLAAGEFDGTDAASAIRDLLDLDSYDEGDY